MWGGVKIKQIIKRKSYTQAIPNQTISIKYKNFDILMKMLIKQIKRSKIKYNSVYGLQRGGLPIAVHLSNVLNIPMVSEDEIEDSTLIVDDIADSGHALSKFEGHNDIAVICKNFRNKTDTKYYAKMTRGWVVFPWEQY